jgi:SAM-dependent methyltransferase
MQPPPDAWFNPLARYLGPAYLRNAFTKGTEQEVGFLVDELGLQPGMRVLDAGCGPGRHSLALAARGIHVVGVDLSDEFIALARATAAERRIENARFEVHDIRALPFEAEFDAVICLCQGGFGLLGGGRDEVDALRSLAAALRPGGRLALSAFNAYFVLRYLEDSDTFDAATGVNHERATLRDPDGNEQEFDLWTTCFTPRELRALAEMAGLRADAVYGVTPGGYRRAAPSIEVPEHLLVATRT